MGPNGSGKSTLAHVLAGKASYEVTEGQVLLDGETCLRSNLTSAPPGELFLAFDIRSKFRASPLSPFCVPPSSSARRGSGLLVPDS